MLLSKKFKLPNKNGSNCRIKTHYIVWLSKILYPDIFTDNIVPVVQEFFEKFYHYSLTEEEAEDIMDPFPSIAN